MVMHAAKARIQIPLLLSFFQRFAGARALVNLGMETEGVLT